MKASLLLLFPLFCPLLLTQAQLPGRVEVFVSTPMVGSDGQLLPGSSPSADEFGFPVVAGCRVEILNPGADGKANPPNLDGSPGGDDVLVKVAAVGQGMTPSQTESGQFAISFPSQELNGAPSLYARVFNAPERTAATHWGQSSVGQISGDRLDLGILGLWGTSQAAGVDATTTDSDSDGRSDWEEAVAGTSALDAGDSVTITEVEDGKVILPVVAGRSYVVYRSTDPLGDGMTWSPVATVSPQQTASQLQVALPELPGQITRAFYRYEVQ